MTQAIEKELFREKVERDDSSVYVGNLLIRQRLINEAVLQFAEPFLPTGSRVVDACAGPEGSWLAAASRGYKWVGNDISFKFAKILKKTGANVVLSDFPHALFQGKIADGLFFVFALNNICNPRMAFVEAERVTKDGGIIVEAEPGLATWVTKILLHSILSRFPNFQHIDYLNRMKFSSEVEDHFVDKPYSENEYTDLILERTTGKTATELLSLAESSICIGTRKHRVHYGFHQAITRLYFEHISAESQRAGFKLIKAGIMAMAQIPERWEVSSAVEVSTDSWLDQLMKVKNWRRGKHPLIDSFPVSMDTSAKRMVFPVLCMKKE